MSALDSHAKLMHGMDKRHDGHAWTKTITSHIKNDMSLAFHTTTYVGHLHCKNQDSEYTSRIHCISLMNEMEWDGFTLTTFPVKQPTPAGSSLVCKICKAPQICTATYGARIYYFFGTANMTRACVHLKLHKHPVKAGETTRSRRGSVRSLGSMWRRLPRPPILQSSWRQLESSWVSS
jgi:hypothetical protein